MGLGDINLWPNGVATLLLDDYRLAIWESDRYDDEGRTTTDFELLRSGKRVYQGEGPSSGANGYGMRDMRDALASLVTFLAAENERLCGIAGNSEDSIFPDATPELIEFIETHSEDASIAGLEWEDRR